MNIRISDIYSGESLPLRRGAKFGEPSHGWAAAHVEMNFGTSLRTYLDSLGYDGRDIRPAHVLEWVRSLNIQDFALVENATPRFEGNDVTLMGVTVKRRHWSIANRRFCPACLGEDPYHRTWWDLTVFGRCPFHGTDVVSTDEQGNVVQWWWPSFEVSAERYPIRQKNVARTDRLPSTVETWLLGRMGVVDPLETPFFDAIGSVGDSLRAVERLAEVISLGGADEDRANRAFTALAGGEETAFRCIDAVAEEIAPSRKDRRGVEGLFGTTYRNLRYSSKGPHVDVLSDLMKAVAKKHGFQSGYTTYDGVMEGVGMLAVADLATEFGVTPDTMRRFVREVCGIGSNGAHRQRLLNLTTDQVEQVRDALSRLVDADAMCRAMGIGRNLFDGLVRIGLLDSKMTMRTVRLYSLDDAERLNEMAREAPLVVPEDHLVRLGNLSVQHHPAVEKALKAALDATRPDFYVGGTTLGDLLIERVPTGIVARIKVKRHRTRTERVGLPLARAATLIGISNGVALELVKQGHLPTIADTRNIEETVVSEFAATWAPAILYKRTFGRLPSHDDLFDAKVRHIEVEHHDKRSVIVHRADARRAFRLDRDPDAFPPLSPEAFLVRLTKAVTEETSFVTSSNQSTKTAIEGRHFRTTTGRISLTVGFSADLTELVVRRRWDARTPRARRGISETLCNLNKIRDVYTGTLKVEHTEIGLDAWDTIPVGNMTDEENWTALFGRVIKMMKEFQSLLSDQ